MIYPCNKPGSSHIYIPRSYLAVGANKVTSQRPCVLRTRYVLCNMYCESLIYYSHLISPHLTSSQNQHTGTAVYPSSSPSSLPLPLLRPEPGNWEICTSASCPSPSAGTCSLKSSIILALFWAPPCPLSFSHARQAGHRPLQHQTLLSRAPWPRICTYVHTYLGTYICRYCPSMPVSPLTTWHGPK